MAPQTIVQVTAFRAPNAGNFIPCLKLLGRELKSAGMNQTVVFPEGERERQWAKELLQANELRVDFSSSTLNQLVRQVVAIARRERACLMHAHFSPADNASILTWALLRIARPFSTSCGLVCHYHSPPASSGRLQSLLGFFKYRLLGRFFDHVAVSQGTLDLILSRGVPESRCHLVLNAIDLDRAVGQSVTRDEMRAAMNVAADNKVFLLFGHDPHRKGVDLAIDAIQQLHASRADVVLILVGPEPMQKYVHERLTSLPPWLRIAQARSCVADYFAAADIFLSPSRREGLPYAVLEAMANRLPVIAADIPGMEWAHGAPNIKLVPSGNAPSLLDAMRAVLQDPPTEGDAARDFVRQHHSADAWAKQMVAVYQEILARRGAE